MTTLSQEEIKRLQHRADLRARLDAQPKIEGRRGCISFRTKEMAPGETADLSTWETSLPIRPQYLYTPAVDAGKFMFVVGGKEVPNDFMCDPNGQRWHVQEHLLQDRVEMNQALTIKLHNHTDAPITPRIALVFVHLACYLDELNEEKKKRRLG